MTSIPSPPRIENPCEDGVIAPESDVTVLTTVSDNETAPLETPKSAVAKEAIPLLVTVASSPDIVVVPAASSYATSIPSPAVTAPPEISSIYSWRDVLASV